MLSKRMMYFSLVLNVLLVFILAVIIVRYDFAGRFAVKMGWKEAPRTRDYNITMSWNKTMESMKYYADVVFFGASLTSGGNWHEFFDSLKICNLGKSGDNLKTMLWRVPQITAVHPQKIFLAMEHNCLPNNTVDEIIRDYVVLIDSIQCSNPQANLFLESLTPLNERKFPIVCNNEKIKIVNKEIERIAVERGLQYVNIYDVFVEEGQLPMTLSYDGQHLLPEAYPRWVNVVRQFIN